MDIPRKLEKPLVIWEQVLNKPEDPEDWYTYPSGRTGINYATDLLVKPKITQSIVVGDIIAEEYYFPNLTDGTYDRRFTYVLYEFIRDSDVYYLEYKRINQFYIDENTGTPEERLVQVPEKIEFFDTLSEKEPEVKQRRNRIVYNNVVQFGKAFNLDDKISAFFEKYNTEIETYINVGSPSLYNAALTENSPEFSWLDEIVATITPRQAMLGIFYVATNPQTRNRLIGNPNPYGFVYSP